MITFSFSPLRLSTDPDTLASVRTLVVSWKEAAEIKLSVLKDALVIPRIKGSAVAGLPPFSITALLALIRSGRLKKGI